ncbi:ATP-dependent nuclease [Deinococcus wulumuqiensis]|uniref:ATP-dependent nuclease n=1 Tax=Deinococcus wulumuqiensis TaxID=980427 RepID=UPI002431EE19|nr:AAA family ATPase [Deinococcus wulumuqiensis]
MRLKSVKISEYKNLKDFTLNFEQSGFVEIFVGKNGSGKSNFFEALAEIFQHLFEFEDKNFGPSFSYSLKFELESVLHEVSWRPGVLTVNGVSSEDLSQIKLPDHIVVYYSGHNPAIQAIVEKYEHRLKARMTSTKFSEVRKFVGIDSGYKDMLISLLLLQSESSPARQLAATRLKIQSVGQELTLVLKKPRFASRQRLKPSAFHSVENPDPNRFWRVQGQTRDFLDLLFGCSVQRATGPERREGYVEADNKYYLYLDVARLKLALLDMSPQEVFRRFDHLRAVDMLEAMSLPLTLEDGKVTQVNEFSDGQFQSLYIYSVAEFFKDRSYLALLDEPDSFLHPEWQFQFLNQVAEISPGGTLNGQMLITSHSAVTLIPFDRERVRYFDIKNFHSNCYPLPKEIAIKRLSESLIRYTEEEQILSVLNKVSIEEKPILLTEGSTDPIIIGTAWKKLFPGQDMPFKVVCAFSCTHLKQLLVDIRIHREVNGRPIFALFDFDKAFDQWNGINGVLTQTETQRGLVKEWGEPAKAYAIMLPIPKNSEIRRQVFKDDAEKEHFGGDARCEIEHLFYGSSATSQFFEKERAIGGEIVVFKNDGNKVSFAEEIIPRVEKEYFEVFRPLFEFIVSKCAPEVVLN